MSDKMQLTPNTTAVLLKH